MSLNRQPLLLQKRNRNGKALTSTCKVLLRDQLSLSVGKQRQVCGKVELDLNWNQG